MKFKSIITNLRVGFAFTLILLVLVFISYIKYEDTQYLQQTSKYHESISANMKENRFHKHEAIKYLKKLNFEIEFDVKRVFDNSKKRISKRDYETIYYENNFYLHILTPQFRILVKDLNTYDKNYYIYVLFIILFIAFIFMYLWTIKALSPLKSLKKEIQRFADGNVDINCKSNNEDEIAQVANEFDKAVQKISLLLNSRQLFLRTIMHELKTPIAKGRIVSELIEDEKQKNRMISIFVKLNQQIDDFAQIEEVISSNYKVILGKYSISGIIENSIGMLMLDNNNDKIKLIDIPELKISVDLSLISMAIKNLIDNALKYSCDKRISIKYNENKLIFLSEGEKLQKPLEEYFKPFHNDTTSKNHGMGLGLYIVKSILDMHKFKFVYQNTDSKNIFTINMSTVINK